MQATITKYAETINNLPDEMKNLKRWLLWNREVKKDKAGNIKRDSQGNIKYDKVPKQSNGYNASKTNPSHFLTFQEAMNAYETGEFSGIGFVLVKDDPYVIIDLDDCFNENRKLTGKAKSIVDSLDSYTEVSQSGNGLHIVVKGDNIEGFNNHDEHVEMYSQKWFFAMTGNVLRDDLAAIEDRNELVMYLHDMYSTKKESDRTEIVEDQPQVHSDDHILMKARNAKNGEKFISLYDKGDISNYPSESEADEALAYMLAFWTKNSEQIERLMRNSALYREKWDKHPDYLRGRTIQEALLNVKGGYGSEDDFQLNVIGHDKPSLVLTEKNTVKKLLSNLREILLYESKLNGIGFNEFTQEVTINSEPITDDFISEIRLSVDAKYYITFTADDTLQMIKSIAKEKNSYHPIKQMIESKKWDGNSRAETIFIDYLGADDIHYTRSVARKWLAGAVARIYEPGKKMEIVPVLQGKQGIGKSTLASKLGGSFFVDSLASLGNTKDDYQLLIGSWIIELGELASMSSTKTDKVKSFISARFDKLRLPYDKITQIYYRTCVFIGTTNTAQFLNDLTGNRRFFPIPLTKKPNKDVFSLDNETIQQIWAEAYVFYKNGENLFLDDQLDEDVAEVYREQATEESLFFMNIDDYLDMKVPTKWNSASPQQKKMYFEKYQREGTTEGTSTITKTTSKEIAYVLDIDPKDRNAKPQMKKINLYMDNKEGWKKQSVRVNGKSQKGFKRTTA